MSAAGETADVVDTDLFIRSTGLSLESYRKLTEIGVIDVGNMTDAIQKFRYFERKSVESLKAPNLGPEESVAL